MPQFTVGVPIRAESPNIEVTIDAARPLGPGRHTFQLVVQDDAGNESLADRIVIIVADREAPTAVLSGPSVVNVGQSFELSGARSFDTGGGRVVAYTFTYLGPVI